jgi:hypothetical protein
MAMKEERRGKIWKQGCTKASNNLYGNKTICVSYYKDATALLPYILQSTRIRRKMALIPHMKVPLTATLVQTQPSSRLSNQDTHPTQQQQEHVWRASTFIELRASTVE